MQAKEYKVVALRECPLPETLLVCNTPSCAVNYWHLHVKTAPHFQPECECFVVLLLTTKRHVKGHSLVSIGTLDSTLVHPREVFRAAIVAAASAVVLMHNHPSGDPAPSSDDIKITRELIQAGRVVKIEVLDHIIVGQGKHSSLMELGFCQN